jgi:hypothetical protein
MISVYRILLRLYPRSFRSAFADEILATLAEVEEDCASRGTIDRILLAGREIAGLLAGVFVERFRPERYADAVRATVQTPVSDEVVDLEKSIRFHLAQTIDCIAHHKFEGARFHAREEERTRQRLRDIQRAAESKDSDLRSE